MLLDGEVEAPILNYSNGKYLVGDMCVRGALLVQYTDKQLADAREDAIIAKEAASQAAIEAELEAPYAVGDRVHAKAYSAVGEAWFVAEVTGIRSRYPPIRVTFISTLTGETNLLALPTPHLNVYLPASRLRVVE